MKNKLIRALLMLSFYTSIGIIMQAVLLNIAFATVTNAQEVKSIEDIRVSLHLDQASVFEAFREIESKTNFKFAFDTKDINPDTRLDLHFQSATLKDVLLSISKSASLHFRQVNYSIDVRKIKRNERSTESQRIEVIIQDKTVTGRVTSSEDDEGLPGVNVIVKGTAQGTVTDFDGKYSIDVPDENTILVFSSVGFITQEVTVGNRSVIDLTMAGDVTALAEIVVVGYSTQKKVNLTGAVESVEGDVIEKRQVGQTSMALQGLMPGVTVTQDSGQPGEDGGQIRIRGIGTLGTAGQDPLVLIDGVEGHINNVDPGDIENISVLKDAASASIFGSRAANGVVLITTKRAVSKEISVHYNGYVGWQEPMDMPELVSGLDHMLLLNEANENMGQSPTFQQSYIDAYRQNAPSDLYPDTDWQELTLTNDGMIQNHSIEVSGGSDLVKVWSTLNYFKQNGLIPNTGYNRTSLRINTDLKASERLSFRLLLRGSDELQYEPSVGTNTIFYHMNGRIPRNQEGVLSDGRYGQGWLGSNPVSFANASGTADNRMYNAILNLQAEWKPVDGLSLRLMYAPEFYSGNLKAFTHTIETFYGDGSLAYIRPNMSSLLQRSIQTKTDNINALATYVRTFNNNHNLSILGGYEQIEYSYESFQARRENFPLENYQLQPLGSEVNQQTDGNAYEYALRSFFGRVNYNFKEKYLVEANLRYDGSSRFAGDNKYGLFPSFSAGWRISEENFLSGVDAINDLKIRGSWGSLGNQNIGNYPFASSVNLTRGYILNEIAVSGAALLDLGNEDISWETTEIVNIGFDLTFLEMFSTNVDFYRKNTENILLTLPIPMTVGYNPPYQNAGIVRNTGWEIGLRHFNTVKDFNYEVSFVLSDVKNEIIDLKGTGPYISNEYIRMEGQPIDAFYGYQTDGLFQTQEEVDNHAQQFGGLVAPGDVKYVDQNDDDVINADGDRVILGSSIPRYTYSLTFNAAYKGFDVNLFFQGVGQASGYRAESGVWAFYVGSTALTRHLDRWTPDNTDASYPRLTFNYPNNEQISDYWMLNAAYLRLKNLQIGYTLPSKILDGFFLDNVRFYFTGQNIFTIDNYLDSYDVETPNGTSGFYPIVRTFTFGVSVKF